MYFKFIFIMMQIIIKIYVLVILNNLFFQKQYLIQFLRYLG